MAWVLFFDGDCAFCSASVRQVMRFDKHARIEFAPLQGKLAATLDFDQHAAETGGTMILLRESDSQVFTRSDALIELARVLGGWWRLCMAAWLIPRPLRDWVYAWVADHRYRFMGRATTCALPDAAWRKRLRE